MKTVVLIPSLRPDRKLINLINGLIEVGLNDIIIVDDGSGEEYRNIFDSAQSMGCRVLCHAVNLGKGRALKTGMNYFLNEYPGYSGIVTADSDGQHSPEDILRTAEALEQNPDCLILGSRDFSKENVPKKSMLGNRITRTVFRYLTGLKLTDTQTGLRAIPNDFIHELLRISGEHFEYEMNMLIEAKKQDVRIIEIPIETIYIQNNETSHFNPFRDAVRIYALLGKFAFSSIGSAIIDVLLFALLLRFILPNFFVSEELLILLSTAIARICSSTINFILNKNIVFAVKSGKGRIYRYYLVAAVQMALSAFFVWLLSDKIGIDSIVIKIFVDFILFLCSFKIQQNWVFKKSV